MGLAVPSVSSAIATADPVRVMVVDDSVVVRGLVSRWIEEEPGLAVAASLRNGRDAVDQLDRVDPDVVILDIEMPELDGISALPLMLAKKRDLVVIMASTLTRHNAEISLKALSLGAADYIPKPETNRGVTTSATFRRELIEKIRELGGRRRRRRPPRTPAPAAPAPQPGHRGRLQPARPHSAGARADHPAHAADLHHHPGRAHRARRRLPGARGHRRRAGGGRDHLRGARRQAHAGGQARQRRVHRAR
jgi:two-component system chemotaxis response regulator CheB